MSSSLGMFVKVTFGFPILAILRKQKQRTKIIRNDIHALNVCSLQRIRDQNHQRPMRIKSRRMKKIDGK